MSFSDGLATISLIISLWSVYYTRKNHLASTYPRAHVTLRLVDLDGEEKEEPPHHVKIEVRNLHPQISMSNVEVNLYVSEPVLRGVPGFFWWQRRGKWPRLMTCAPISVIEPTQVAGFEPVGYEANILEDALCVRLPQYLTLENIAELNRRMTQTAQSLGLPPRLYDIRARWYKALMLDHWVGIRVEVTYTPGSTGSRRYKQELVRGLLPKGMPSLNGWQLFDIEPARIPYTRMVYMRHRWAMRCRRLAWKRRARRSSKKYGA